MAYPTFPDLGYGTYGRLAPGSQLAHAPRVLSAQFGGGYELRAGDGYNTNRRTLTARYENLQEADATTLITFLDGRKGYLPFYQSVPGYGAILFTCRDYSRAYIDPIHDTITGTFIECFDP